MALLSQAQINDVTKLAVTMFGAAPGAYKEYFENVYAEVGGDMQAAANAYADEAVYNVMFTGTNEQQADQLMARFGINQSDMVGDVPVGQAAYDFFLGSLNNGESTQDIIAVTIPYIAEDPNFAQYNALLNTKVAVANNFSNTTGADETSLGALQYVINQVTGDETVAEHYDLTLNQDIFNADGSSTQKIFEAAIINGNNSLQSGDVINGGMSDNDTLKAELVAEASEAGINIDTQPTTKSVEIVEIESRDQSAAAGATAVLDAKKMVDIDKIGSSFSDGDLIIENLTTLTSAGTARNTDNITVTMDHTDNMNSDNDASDLTVYFDEDYLLSGEETSGSELTIRMLNAVSNVNGNNPIEGTTQFTFYVGPEDVANAVVVDIADIAGNSLLSGQAAYDAVTARINETLDSLGYTNVTAVTQPAQPAVFSIPVAGYNTGDPAGNYYPIIVTNAGEEDLTKGKFETIDLQYDTDQNNSMQPQGGTTVDNPLAVDVELHKVGREGDGGNLVIGGKETFNNVEGLGIDVFNIDVLGGDDKPSNLGMITSTNNDLDVINVESTQPGTDKEGNATYASLTVRGETNAVPGVAGNPFGGTLDTFNAADFKGDLSIGNFVPGATANAALNINTFTATGGGDVYLNAQVAGNDTDGQTFVYNTAAGEDAIVMDYDLTNAASDNFSLTINTGSADDSVMLTTIAGTASEFLNHAQQQNVAVNTGANDDTVMLNDNQIAAQVDLGSGADTIYVSDDGAQDTTAAKAQWFVNATNPAAGALGNGNQTYNVFKTQVQIDFQDITSAVVAVEYSGDYTTDSKAINEAIKKAIADDPQLSKLLMTTDLMNDGLQIDSLVDRNLAAGDLQINFIAPKYNDEVSVVGFNQSTSARYGNDTADLFGERLTVSNTELSNAWDAYYPTSQGLGGSLNSGTGIYAGLAGTTGTVAGDAANMFTQMFEFVDGISATAGNMQTVGAGTGTLAGTTIYNTLQTQAGANSTFNTINDITGGSGDDVLVLSTREAGGWDTVVLTDSFGHDTIMNFNTGTSATPGTIADQIDFTAFLDAAAAARGSSNNATDRVDQDVAFTYTNLATVPGGGLPGAVAVFDHNAVVSVNLSGLFNNFTATAATLPKSFDNISDAMMSKAMNDLLTGYINTAGVATAADMDGSKFVIRLVEDAQIELNGTGDATLGNTIATPLVEQIYSGTIVWNSTAGALEFSTVNREGTLEYGDMFSDLSNVAAESVTGTAAAKAEEAAAEAALKNDTDVANPATLVNASQTATSDANGYPQVVNANGATVSLDNMTVGNGATVTVSYAQIKAWNTFGDLDINKVTGGTGAVTINGTGDDAATNYAIGGSADYTVTALLADTLDAANVTGNVTVTTADKAATVTTGSGSNTINGNAISDNTTLTVTGDGDATITVVDGDVNAAAATGDLNITGTGTQDKTLAGGTGDDTITGGTGDDTITGGTGTNTLTGGAGADAFTTVATAVDTITDLETGDTIDNTGKVTATNVTSYVTAAAADFGNNGANEDAIIQAAAAGATIDLSAATSTTAGATIVGGAGVDTLTGSDQDDIVVVATTAELTADTIDGLAATGGDVLKLSTDAQTITQAAFVNTSNMNHLMMANGANSVTIDGTQANAGSIDTITGGTGVDTIDLTGHNTATTVNGGEGADVITASGNGDTIVGGAGVDDITLAAGVDTVVLNYSNVGSEADVLKSFVSNTDIVSLSLSALETAGTSGIASTVTDFVDLNDGTSAVIGGASTLDKSGAATFDVDAAADLIVLFGATFADTDTLETALEVGGSAAMTGVSAAVNASDAFLIVYSDGTNAYVASAITSNGDNGAGGFASGDLTINNLAVIDTDPSVVTGDYANFAFIA